MKGFIVFALGVSVSAFVLALTLFDLSLFLASAMGLGTLTVALVIAGLLAVLEKVQSVYILRRRGAKHCSVCEETRVRSGAAWLCLQCDVVPTGPEPLLR